MVLISYQIISQLLSKKYETNETKSNSDNSTEHDISAHKL